MKRIRFLITLIFLILFASVACAAEPSPLINPDDIRYQPLTFTPPKAERVVLENGMILYILEDHEIPIVNISAIIRTGSIYNPEEKEGLAEITGDVMRTGGTKNMTGDEIDDALEYFAGAIDVSIGMESGSATLSVLKENLDEGLDIFSAIIMNPVFDENKLKTAKNLKIEALRRVLDEPQKVAFREFRRLIYAGNPRGKLPSIDSVGKIARDDLVRVHGKFFYPGNLMMAVVGDITRDEAVSKIKRYWGAWNRKGETAKIPYPKAKQKGATNYIFKDVPQSTIIIGHLTPEKKNPDFYPFTVLDFILGSGGFRSRIIHEVRNNLGLAYSTGSFYSGRSGYGIFGAYAITKTSSTAKVLSLIMSIINDVRNKGVTESELSWAKKSINNRFIFAFDSTDQIAVQQMMIEYNKLPENFLTTYRTKIGNVTAEDLKRVAEKYLPPNRATILVVGKENLQLKIFD
ncbi:MAG: insulinase family protein [Proteobacteria bacterium]|nr:insulinase family protein [Pseudomonadota bacterium]